MSELLTLLVSQGIRAVLAESYERIHRSNLVGMGVIPLEYLPGENADTLGLTGRERYTISIPETLKPRMKVQIKVSQCLSRPGPAKRGPMFVISLFCLFVLIWSHCRSCRILVPHPGIELMSPALGE